MTVATREYVYQRPWMYPQQQAAVWASERYSIVEASTKSGKTVACMVWLFEQAMQGKQGRNYWWVAPVYAQAKIVFRRLKNAIPRHLYTANENDLTITLVNGAVLWFKSGEQPDSLYGEDVYAAVIDEASRVKEQSWHAVRSTLTATRGPVRIIGNVKGRRNWSYELARRAESGEQNMHYARITAHDAVEAGVLAQAEVEDAQRTLPDAVFRELYLAEPADDADAIFSPAWWNGQNRYDWHDETLARKVVSRIFSWDTAESEGGDGAFTACVVLDVLPDYRMLVREVRRDRIAFPDLVAAIERVAGQYRARDGKRFETLVEYASSGRGAVQTLDRVAPDWLRPIRRVTVRESKAQRALSASVHCRNGMILLPEPCDAVGGWLYDFEDELYAFPNSLYKDQVDAFSHAVRYRANFLASGHRRRTQTYQEAA